MHVGARDIAIEADPERRFGGLRRLYGDAGYAHLRRARVAIVGLGGVGSWAAEALARSGVAALTLIDLDQIAESNINRQVQALGSTVGAAKVDALAARIADIHPGCAITKVEEFVGADNWPGLLASPVDAVIDACDDLRAKLVLAGWALADRIADIHPSCAITKVGEFVGADNWPGLLASPVDAVIDACDDLRAKHVQIGRAHV